MHTADFSDRILAWHRIHGRTDLPWQQQISAYRVWVSEIMLQQTRVSTVIPYFERFMVEFPDVKTLADASLDRVLGFWSGLGYYARARNLHKAALQLQQNDKFPDTVEPLCRLPGIGRSTAGAIVSIAFGKRAAILDGNVKRVLTRYYGIEDWPGSAKVNRRLWDLSESLTPTQSTAKYSQAIMDLGATVCKRLNPDCTCCPLRTDCLALKTDRTRIIPAPRPQKEKPVRIRYMLLLENAEGAYFLLRRPPAGIWGGLWCPPEFESRKEVYDWCEPYEISSLHWLPPQQHSFSHFHMNYSAAIARFTACPDRVQDDSPVVWHNPANPEPIGLPAPICRLFTLAHELDLHKTFNSHHTGGTPND